MSKTLETASRTHLVAEVGGNHMGNMDVAVAYINACAAVGVDTVKFQSWQAAALRPDFPDYDATYARHKKTELTDEYHHLLIKACTDAGVNFLTTCFHPSRIPFLKTLGLKRIKVASPDCGNIPFLDKLANAFEQLIISTGMTTQEELEKTIQWAKERNVILMHCVSLYPAPLAQTNLARMIWMRDQGCRVGFSDHSIGAEAAKLAIALGAEIVEKHVTFSRAMPGKDQGMSSTVEELGDIAKWRDAVPAMLGESHPGLSEEEMKLRRIYIGKWSGQNA